MKQIDLTEGFLRLWKQQGQGKLMPEREHAFHPERKWRFDLAWPEYRLAVEIEGGLWVKGRHNRGKGLADDCDKYNEAIELGWAVLRYTTRHLTQEPVQCVEQAMRVLAERMSPV